MARRVFFSFDYRFVWKVNQIRSKVNIIGCAAAGFSDASLWEESKNKSDAAIKKLIDDGLNNTSVTAVLVNRGTKDRKFIDYEIEQSLARGNGLVAVQIHNFKDQNGNTGSPGAIPNGIENNGFKAYKYSTAEAFEKWIEEAATIAGKQVGQKFSRIRQLNPPPKVPHDTHRSTFGNGGKGVAAGEICDHLL